MTNPREPRTLLDAAEQFANAWRDFVRSLITSFRIDDLVDWINRRLQR